MDGGMEQIKVWTKQHENVLKELNENGRYIAGGNISAVTCRSMRDWCWRYMTGW